MHDLRICSNMVHQSTGVGLNSDLLVTSLNTCSCTALAPPENFILLERVRDTEAFTEIWRK